MFGADVPVTKASGLDYREFDDVFGPGGLWEPAQCDLARLAGNNLRHFRLRFAEIDAQVLQNVGTYSAPLLDQPQQDVFRADTFMVEPLGFLVCQLHDLLGAVRPSPVRRPVRWLFLFVIDRGGRGGHRIAVQAADFGLNSVGFEPLLPQPNRNLVIGRN